MHILATISTGKKLERRKLGGKGIRMDSFGASEVSSRIVRELLDREGVQAAKRRAMRGSRGVPI